MSIFDGSDEQLEFEWDDHEEHLKIAWGEYGDDDPPPLPSSSHLDHCTCESFNLFNFGCKCGFMERDKRRKELTKLIEIDEEKRRREKEKEKEKKLEKYVSDDVGW